MTRHKQQVILTVALVAMTRITLFSQSASPRDLLARFWELDGRGAQLFPERGRNVSEFFVASRAPRHNGITIIRDLVVGPPAFMRTGFQFYVEYTELGRIDLSKMRLSSSPQMMVRKRFEIVDLRAESGSPEPDWRINGVIPEPHVTVETAIRYIDGIRRKATDDFSRDRATKLITALERMR